MKGKHAASAARRRDEAKDAVIESLSHEVADLKAKLKQAERDAALAEQLRERVSALTLQMETDSEPRVVKLREDVDRLRGRVVAAEQYRDQLRRHWDAIAEFVVPLMDGNNGRQRYNAFLELLGYSGEVVTDVHMGGLPDEAKLRIQSARDK